MKQIKDTRSATRRVVRFVIFPFIALIVLAALFYGVEDMRGWYAWRQYKIHSAAAGVNLEWSKFVPPAVPADQNFFQRPEMSAWFVGRGENALTRRTMFNSFGQLSHEGDDDILAQIVVAPADAPLKPQDADIVLQFRDHMLSLARAPEKASGSNDSVIPLMVMDHVPLQDAIKNLTAQARLKYVLDAGLPHLQEEVSLRWENISATDALSAILHRYGLKLLPAAGSETARIVGMIPCGSLTDVEPAVRDAITKVFVNAFETAPDGQPRRHLIGALNLDISTGAAHRLKRARIVVRADHAPTAQEVMDFFPAKALSDTTYSWMPTSIKAEPDGQNFKIYMSEPQQVAAEGYIEASDTLTNDFAQIESALQLPFARMDGDYYDPANLPQPNNISVRIVAQTLSQRAQSYLLLNRPDDALRDLTLLHHFSRLLEAHATGKPVSMISALINSAIVGMYVGTAADGIRLQVWREHDLAVIQQQMADVNLLPLVHDAFVFESAFQGHMAESMSSREMAEQHAYYYKTFMNDKYKDPAYLFLTLAPHGWIYQNIARADRMEQGLLDSYGLTNNLIFPQKTERQIRETKDTLAHPSPYTYYASVEVADYSRAIQTVAKNQTLANEAFIVCALERYRFVHGQYPETLDRLKPAYLAQVPADLIGGAPLNYRLQNGRFLLYSVGWNEQDDGGRECWDENGNGDATKNDWVWPYQPATAQRKVPIAS